MVKNQKNNFMIKTVLIAVLITCAFSMKAQITQQQADDIVITNVESDTIGCVIYRKNDATRRGDAVFTADGEVVRHDYENSYIYFIDDNPSANWAHRCRYCVIDAATGRYSVENQMWYPADFETFTCMTEREITAWHWPYNNYTIPEKAEPNGNLYAVLIGGTPGGHNPIKTWYNLSCIYTALVNNYGFMEATEDQPTHIFVLAEDGPRNFVYNNVGEGNYPYGYDLNHDTGLNSFGFPEDDFIDPDILEYSKNGIEIIFKNLSGTQSQSENITFIPQLTENDQLFVCLCGHGSLDNGMSYFRVFGENHSTPGKRLYDWELAQWTRNINCSQITFMIDCCYSGGFIDELKNDHEALCKNRSVHTCTDANTEGYVEQHITRYSGDKSPDGSQRVDEFVYYWSAASLGYYPILEMRSDSLLGPWHQYDSTAIGQFPWHLFPTFNEGNGYSHDEYDVSPDTNRDGIVSMEEAFTFADNLDSYSQNGYFNSAITQPTPLCSGIEYPCQSYESSFTRELITLDGYKGLIDNDAETGRGHTYQLAGSVIVGRNSSLTINDGCTIDGNGFGIKNLGDMRTQSNAQGITIGDTYILNDESRGFSLSGCTFNDCGTVTTYDGPFSISNSIFNGTTIEANTNNPPRTGYNINIDGNIFNDSTSVNPCIYMRKIPQCSVIGNTIKSGGDGIELRYLRGMPNNYVISGNRINGCAGSGIVAYNSSAILSNNCINNNHDCGIKSLNLSNLQITGDSTARSLNQTPHIYNNERYQVYASSNSYPTNFRYNWLQGNGNQSGDTILYYESSASKTSCLLFDVSYNCWYPLADNEIARHIYTNGGDVFHYLPTWHPLFMPGMPLPPQRLLESGDDYAEGGYYDSAMGTYRTLVDTYPDSPEAVAALKSMFSVTGVSEGDFMELKAYYSSLYGNNSLVLTADNLSNKCDEKLENYDDAIEWYEDMIADDNASFSDRVFAEIDLGNLYLEMDADGNSKGSTGTSDRYKPLSKITHTKHSRQLLSLLPHTDGQNGMELMQPYMNHDNVEIKCSPNPVKDILNIHLTDNIDTAADVVIYDMHGNIVASKSFGGLQDSVPVCMLDMSDVPDGLYFCKVTTGSASSNVQKIIVKH